MNSGLWLWSAADISVSKRWEEKNRHTRENDPSGAVEFLSLPYPDLGNKDFLHLLFIAYYTIHKAFLRDIGILSLAYFVPNDR